MAQGNQTGGGQPPQPFNPVRQSMDWMGSKANQFGNWVGETVGGVGREVGNFLSPTPPSPIDFAGAAQADAQGRQAATDAQTLQNRPNQQNAFGVSTQWTTGPDGRPVQTQSFGGPMGGLFSSLQGQAAQSMGQPLNFGGLGGMPQALNFQGGGQQMPGNAAGVGGPNMMALNPGQDPRTAMPDPTQARQQAIDAAFGQASSRLDPMWQQREEGMRTQLLNQGLTPGTEAYDKQMAALGQQRNDAYQGALNSAIMQGTDAGNALFRQGLDQNAQHLGAQGQFFGQTLGANNQELARQGQMFGQGMGLDRLGLDAQGQFFGQNLQGQNQGFNQGMEARRQGIDEMMMQRNAPLQSLLSMGGMLGMPGFNSAGSAGGPDMLGAAALQGNQDMERWRGTMANNTGLIQGGAQGIGALLPFLMTLSDERAKTNIVRHDSDAIPGVPWATFEYRHEPGVKHVGVIAQDLEKVSPGHVYEKDGLKHVDYSFLGGRHDD